MHTFAQHRVPTFSPAKLWRQTGIFTLALLLAIGLTNLLVDPFDLGFGPSLKLERAEAMRPVNTVMWSLGEFRHIPEQVKQSATVAILGDSRTMQLTQSERVATIKTTGGNITVINLGIGGCTYEELIDTLRYELPQFSALKTVILTMPLERIGTKNHERTLEAFKYPSQPWSYLFNLRMLDHSIHLLWNPKPPQAPVLKRNIKVKPVENPNLPPADAEWGNVVWNEDLVDWATQIKETSFELARQRIEDDLTPLADELRKRNIGLVFFIPPLNPYLKGVYEQAEGANHAEYVNELSKLGLVLDYMMNRPPEMTYSFVDSVHFRRPLARQIMTDILNRSETHTEVGAGEKP